MKSNRPQQWTEIIAMPDCQPTRQTVNMQVMRLATDLVSNVKDKVTPEEHRQLIDIYYDSLINSDLIFQKTNNESYRE